MASIGQFGDWSAIISMILLSKTAFCVIVLFIVDFPFFFLVSACSWLVIFCGDSLLVLGLVVSC